MRTLKEELEFLGIATASEESKEEPKEIKEGIDGSKLDAIVREVSRMTDRNAHSAALAFVADELVGRRDKKLQKAAHAVEDLHMYVGHLPSHLYELRNEIRNHVLNVIRKHEGDEVADAIHNAM